MYTVKCLRTSVCSSPGLAHCTHIAVGFEAHAAIGRRSLNLQEFISGVVELCHDANGWTRHVDVDISQSYSQINNKQTEWGSERHSNRWRLLPDNRTSDITNQIDRRTTGRDKVNQIYTSMGSVWMIWFVYGATGVVSTRPQWSARTAREIEVGSTNTCWLTQVYPKRKHAIRFDDMQPARMCFRLYRNSLCKSIWWQENPAPIFLSSFFTFFIHEIIMHIIFEKEITANRGLPNEDIDRRWEKSNLRPSGWHATMLTAWPPA